MSPRTSDLSADGEALLVPMCAIFRRFLKHRGLKFTPERAQILNSVLNKPGVFEAEQLLMEMRSAGLRVSKATIYRTLKHLLEAGIVTEVLIDSHQSHYQLSFGRGPVGHLVCVQTGKVIEFDAREIQPLRDRICREHGFDPVSFRLVIYGSPVAQRGDNRADGRRLSNRCRMCLEFP